jgi:AAHS family benzoate transporter-like MFS transporter
MWLTSSTEAPVMSRTLERTVLTLAALFTALEGYDLACYGVTVPSLLKDSSLGVSKAAAGTAGSLVAVGMMVGAALAAALIRRTGSRRLLIGGATPYSPWAC